MDTLTLIQRAHNGDKDAKTQIVEKNMGLVWSVVKRFRNRGYDKEDLFQIGSIGLIKAIDKFDQRFDVQFSTYAIPLITGEIKRFLRDDGMIKVSRIIKENKVKIVNCTDKFRNEAGRDPTINEIVELTNLNKDEILSAMDATYDIESLDKVIYAGENSEITLMEKIEDNRREEEKFVDRMYIYQLMDKLEVKEKKLILLRYFEEKTQSEIARLFGTSQVQISRMEKKILERLREYA